MDQPLIDADTRTDVASSTTSASRWRLVLVFSALLIAGLVIVALQFSILSHDHDQSANPLPIHAVSAPHPSNRTVISNILPHRDIYGAIMDIHDGNILYHNHTYYYYGTGYGPCAEVNSTSGCTGAVFGKTCGFHYNHNLSLYTSVDWQNWTPAPEPPFQIARDFPSPSIVMFCTKVIYNTRTREFVLWFNWNTNVGFIGVAVAKSPFGPFTIVNQQVKTLARSWPSDFGLFQDDDGRGYVIYSGQNIVTIESLTDNFYETLGGGSGNASAPIGPMYVEAPAMFKRNGLYYASTGAECCYCREGSAAVLYVAHYPLGPYNATTTLSGACRSQQTDVTMVYDSEGHKQYLYRGDRWQQAPDGVKAHDPTYVGLIEWDDKGLARPLKWVDNFTLSVGTGPRDQE